MSRGPWIAEPASPAALLAGPTAGVAGHRLAELLPCQGVRFLPAAPVAPATGLAAAWAEGIAMALARQEPVITGDGTDLVLPVGQGGATVALALVEGLAPETLRRASVPWLLERAELFVQELHLLADLCQDAATGLPSAWHLARALEDQLAQAASPGGQGFALALLETFPRARDAGQAWRQIGRLADRLAGLFRLEAGTHHLGCGVFAILWPATTGEEARRAAAAILRSLRRDELTRVHIGLRAVTPAEAPALAAVQVQNEAWAALALARRRAPFAFAEHADDRIDPLPPPPAAVRRQLARAWRGLDRFALLLLSGSLPVPADLASRLAGLVPAGTPVLPAGAGEAYLLLAAAGRPAAEALGTALRDALAASGWPVAVGIAVFPFLDLSAGTAPLLARRALLHGAFLGPGSVVACDAVSLNIGGDAFYNRGELVRAARDYRLGLRLDAANVNLHNSLGVTLAELGRHQAACACFEQALALAPGDRMAACNLGFGLLAQGRRPEAIRAFEGALAGDRRQPDILVQLARLLLQEDRPQEAAAILVEAEALDPDKAVLHRTLGEALWAAGEADKARPRLERALRLDPHDPWAMSLLGLVYAETGQGLDLARSLCQQALERDDRPWELWLRLARVEELAGTPAAALASLRAMGRQLGRQPAALVLAGRLYEALGQRRQARRCREKAHRLGARQVGPALVTETSS
ncbi:MAG: tetratricopeptide repeat protein [Thermodesulfobacteriota bacterium]